MQQSTPNLPSLQRSSRSKGKLKFSEMKRSQSQSCTVRSTIPSSGSRRYQNVEKIAKLIEDIKAKDLPKGEKTHEAVVEGFKQKIRNTFNELYGNYEQNKQIITHEIKNLEKNKTSHIQMSTKFQQTLKEKNQYDKLKLEVDTKNKKLIKLREILQRERDARSEKDLLQQDLKNKIAELKQQKIIMESLDYERAVLENMRISRRILKESLKKRFNEYFEEFSERSRKIHKFYNQNQVKKKLIADLSKQMPGEEIIIPENFAIELQNKLEHLYGKEAFQNIFYHESIINQEANRGERQREIEQREARRKVKEQLERQEKRELDRVEGEYIRNKEIEERFLKQCGIRSLSEIIDYRTDENRQELQILKQQLEARIKLINKQNSQISEQIRKVLSRNTDIEATIHNIQKQYTTQHEQQKKLSHLAEKNNKFLQTLQSIIDRITQQSGPIQDMNLKLAKFSSRLEKVSEWKKKRDGERKKIVKIPELEIKKNETENTVLLDKEDEYLEEHIQSVRKK